MNPEPCVVILAYGFSVTANQLDEVPSILWCNPMRGSPASNRVRVFSAACGCFARAVKTPRRHFVYVAQSPHYMKFQTRSYLTESRRYDVKTVRRRNDSAQLCVNGGTTFSMREVSFIELATFRGTINSSAITQMMLAIRSFFSGSRDRSCCKYS